MRDTPFLEPAPTNELEDKRYAPLWNDLDKMPWAAYSTPHAKIVKDGTVTKSGNPADP